MRCTVFPAFCFIIPNIEVHLGRYAKLNPGSRTNLLFVFNKAYIFFSFIIFSFPKLRRKPAQVQLLTLP